MAQDAAAAARGDTSDSLLLENRVNGPNVFTCPVCGYLGVNDLYAPCEICAWEYCPAQSSDPDEGGAPNFMTLRQAQRNYQQWGAIAEKYLELTRKPTSTDVRDPDWKPLDST